MQILTTSSDSVGAGSDSPGETWQQVMKTAIRTVPDLLDHLKLTANPVFETKAESKFPVFAPLPYLQRIRPQDPADPLLRQVLPVSDEDESPPHFRSIHWAKMQRR